MVRNCLGCLLCLLALWSLHGNVSAQQAGGVRGIVYDKDFEAPLAAAQVTIAETDQKAETSDQGNYVISELEPGNYTLVFSKDGYTRQVKANVVVNAGQMTEQDAWLTGDFAEMEEFVVQDLQITAGTEAALLELRIESPALMDSISADLMSQAGAGDAASALKLVAGTTVQDGKYAVVRGLPDRYVNSQINSIRLPTADADKRAVQLDQFPSDAIESIQVSKTFTPDQQGDASGGAVNVILKSIPDEPVFKFGLGSGVNTQKEEAKERFLIDETGGVGTWGREERPIPEDQVGESWDGAVGGTADERPIDYDFSVAAGGKYGFFDDLFSVGGFASFFYERDSSYYEDGIDDKYWVEEPGGEMTPQYGQGTPRQGDFKTSLFDITQSAEEVKWGGLGSVGIETENHSISLVYLYTRNAQSKVTLAEDTRAKAYYFPGYDPDDPTDPGNQERDAAPYLRTQTIQYTERETETVQLRGEHKLPDPGIGFEKFFMPLGPEIDWSVSESFSGLYQPDKRQFGSLWYAEAYNPGRPPWVPPFTRPEEYRPYKPAANFTLGNLQRIWKEITEESEQYSVNLKLPFRQWTGDEGYFKVGVFHDEVLREYFQDSFSNFNDNSATYQGGWDDPWSQYFPDEEHPITAAEIDVDYIGEQYISAWYYMADIPLTSFLNVIGGKRYETTDLSIINIPETDVNWYPPGAPGAVKLQPGDADVVYYQEDVLPSYGFKLHFFDEKIMFRGNYSETTARQTFKELTPIQQQEFLGGDVFIGNPGLQMSALKNYDLRLDLVPYEGGLVSVSWFRKKITNPIEYVQRIAEFAYTTPINYPEGELEGWEFELRQKMGEFWEPLTGLTLGGNATLIESEVTLPPEEAALFTQPNIQAPMPTRDMVNAPEHLYNLFMSYEMDRIGLTGTQLGVFYTVRGDTLIAGAGQSKGKFVPNVYETEYGTLNMSLSQKLGEHWKIKFSAKNLLDPEIQSVYRSEYIGEDVVKTSYKKGIDFSLGISGSF